MPILWLKINIYELFFGLISKEVYSPSKCLIKQISNNLIYKLIKKWGSRWLVTSTPRAPPRPPSSHSDPRGLLIVVGISGYASSWIFVWKMSDFAVDVAVVVVVVVVVFPQFFFLIHFLSKQCPAVIAAKYNSHIFHILWQCYHNATTATTKTTTSLVIIFVDRNGCKVMKPNLNDGEIFATLVTI